MLYKKILFTFTVHANLIDQWPSDVLIQLSTSLEAYFMAA